MCQYHLSKTMDYQFCLRVKYAQRVLHKDRLAKRNDFADSLMKQCSLNKQTQCNGHFKLFVFNMLTSCVQQ